MCHCRDHLKQSNFSCIRVFGGIMIQYQNGPMRDAFEGNPGKPPSWWTLFGKVCTVRVSSWETPLDRHQNQHESHWITKETFAHKKRGALRTNTNHLTVGEQSEPKAGWLPAFPPYRYGINTASHGSTIRTVAFEPDSLLQVTLFRARFSFRNFSCSSMACSIIDARPDSSRSKEEKPPVPLQLQKNKGLL